jgi:hypothetical protein
VPVVAVTDDGAAAVMGSYRRFAGEVGSRSAAYGSLAAAVAEDPDVVGFIASLPPPKRQPNLLFAAARYLLGVPPDISRLRELVSQSRARLTELMLARRTQTNEPARCAVLLPALAQLPEPLALIEAGASAGLTLLFDRYSYDYAGHRLAGSDPDAPVLRCEPRGRVPLPPRIPAIVWRAGLDLNPLDVTDDEDVRWLSCLVWPGEDDRQQRLAAAVASARRDPPVVYRGDLLTGLPGLAAQAPPGATLVVYHCSVLYQVEPDQREKFTGAVAALGAAWLSNEEPGLLRGTELSALPPPPRDGLLGVLARDGHPVAFTDSHGRWLRWLP